MTDESFGERIEKAAAQLREARAARDTAGAERAQAATQQAYADKRALRAANQHGTPDEIRSRARIEAELARSAAQE